MFNDSPQFDPENFDPVTGAPLIRSRRTSYSYDGRRSSGNFVGVPIPVPTVGVAPASPYAYSPQAFFPSSPYLSPSQLPSPQLVPTHWVNSYYDQFNRPVPIAAHENYERSPRRRATQLSSPNVSPYVNTMSLPVFADEPQFQDPRETWASRFRNWITGEDRSDPHRQLNRIIHINAVLNYKDSGIRWNMAYPPHTITLRRLADPDGPAFSPPLSSCRIVSPLMPWVIEVTARDGSDFITNMSLLTDLYNCFKKGIERNVYEGLPRQFKTLVDETYRLRCSSIPDEFAAEAAFDYGIRRIDFLLGKVYFIGLAQVKDMFHTFELRVSVDA